jgi:hypothetical protein
MDGATRLISVRAVSADGLTTFEVCGARPLSEFSTRIVSRAATYEVQSALMAAAHALAVHAQEIGDHGCGQVSGQGDEGGVAADRGGPPDAGRPGVVGISATHLMDRST